jgi:serine/threonine-protein kinase
MEADPTSDLARSGIVVANRYRLDSVIGRGGMGSVWSATHLGLGHRIAIKLISRELIRSPDALRRFDAEAKAAARLQSRHVVQVYDNGTLDDGTPYIAMELLSGDSLEHRIEQRGRVELAEAVHILAQCCKALGRAHAIGIVHRDIKPDNIFLARTPDEDGDVTKILDFGIAKVAMAEGSQGQTGTGMLLGTPLYMSPEQARGLKGIDGRSDLYSLGLAAYTMLSGKLAISGESFGEILLKICVEPLPGLRVVAPWLPPTMEEWFQRACAREPAARFQSAQEFTDALRVAAGEGSTVGRLLAEQSGPQPVIAPTMVAAGVSAGGSAPYGSAGASTGAGPANPPSVNLSGVNVAITAAGVPRRNTAALVVGAVMAAMAIGAVMLLVALRPRSTASDAPSETQSAASSIGPSAPSALPSPETVPSPIIGAPSPHHSKAPAQAKVPAEAEAIVHPATTNDAPVVSPSVPTSRAPTAAHPAVAAPARGAAPVVTSTPAPVAATAPAPVPARPASAPPVINLGY